MLKHLIKGEIKQNIKNYLEPNENETHILKMYGMQQQKVLRRICIAR